MLDFIRAHRIGLAAAYLAVLAVALCVMCWTAEPDPYDEP